MSIIASALLLSAAVSGVFTAPVERAVFANQQYAKALESQADVLTGKYQLVNVRSGKRVSFNRDGNVPNLGLTTSGASIELTRVKGNWIRFEPADSGKCFSAQWDGNNGIDWAATLYRCCTSASDCDNGNYEKLRYQKQSYLLVPVGSSAASSASRANRSSKRSSELDERDGIAEASNPAEFERALDSFNHPGPKLDQREAAAAEPESESVVERAEAATESKSKAYHIVVVDHYLDMKTRVITGKIMSASGGLKSLALDDLDVNDEAQQWRLVRA